ncbi:MAG: glycosyltransferase family 2 protein [Clostridia bacterium]|nr:glycosyltransferase family 2 protein [Clostridia bacterium]
MNNKKVIVLMSTYNGEKYIKDQLDSIINQTYPNIDILIRDDGSTDKTTEIIRQMSNKKTNIILLEENNIGFINSFFELLEKTPEADYYAYCDQDDVWMEDKIERAVDFLEKTNPDKPALYFSNSDYYDGDMNFLETAEKNKVFSFRNSLVECVTQGMTMVINNKTKNTIIKERPKECLYHDWWTYMICSGFGQIVYDEKSLVKYRRHNKSVTVEGKGFIELFIFRVKKFFVGDSLKKIKLQWNEFKRLYIDNLNEENQKLLTLFTKKYSFVTSLRKVFYPRKFRRKIIDDISVRLLFLFGRL